MKLHGYFTDNAVLCGGKEAKIFGFAEAGEEIIGELKGAEKEFRAKTVADENGKFMLEFPEIKRGYEKFTLTVCGKSDAQVCENIVFGEVYYAAGQSNMEYALRYLEKRDKLISDYASEHIRFINVPCFSVMQDKDGRFWGDGKLLCDVSGSGWHTTGADETTLTCSGFGFIFAGEMQKKLGCPVGIINVSVGGSGIEHWLPPEVIEREEKLEYYKYSLEKKSGKITAGCIYREVVNPFCGFDFGGILWYQGESSAWDYKNAFCYRYALERLIKIFRRDLGDLPLLAIHIAIEKYDKFGANTVNESINVAAANTENVEVCPLFDLPHRYFNHDGAEIYHPIHTVSKKEAATRAAEIYYNRFVAENGKICARFKRVESNGNRIKIYFSGAKGALKADGKIIGFTVAGEDKVYHLAQAEITGKNTVEVFSPYVSAPKHVCYGFYMYNNDCNLYADDLPVLPFRTDGAYDAVKNFIEPPAYTRIPVREAMETAFSSENGGVRFVSAWTVGKLFGGANSKIAYGKDYVALCYEKDENGYYFYGISPEINIAYGENMLSRFEFAVIEIESEADVFFAGLTARTSDGEQFTFGITDGGELSRRKAVKKGERLKLEIPLSKAYHYAGNIIPVSAEVRRKICAVQFTFRDFEREEGKIKLFSVDFHN